jgi:hypothetical protein
MTVPSRWRDDPSAPQGVRDALSAGRSSRPLPGDSRLRSASRVDRLVAVPAAASLLFWIKGAAIASLCVAGTVAIVHEVGRPANTLAAQEARPPEGRGSRAQPTVPQSQRAPLAALVDPPTTVRALEASPPAIVRVDDHALPALRSPSPDGAARLLPSAPKPVAREPIGIDKGPVDSGGGNPLAREAAMLEDARAMVDKNPRAALAALDRYTALFPAGVLSIERDLLAVEALRRLERPVEAHARAAALLDRARGSLYEPRIRAMMGE